MRSGVVYYRDQVAGVIARFRSGAYEFRYLKAYRERLDTPSLAASLSKEKAIHTSRHLFAFFYGLLSEGVQKESQCRMLRIDEADHFGRLLQTCQNGCIGAVRVGPRPSKK